MIFSGLRSRMWKNTEFESFFLTIVYNCRFALLIPLLVEREREKQGKNANRVNLLSNIMCDEQRGYATPASCVLDQ